MTLLLLVASYLLFSTFFLHQRIRSMSASTDALSTAVAALTAQTSTVVIAIAELRAAPKADPADTAAVDKAATDIIAAVASLQAAIG